MTEPATERIRVHDLLEVDLPGILGLGEGSERMPAPSWFSSRTEFSTFVHVRRGVENDGWIPIGIRGPSRSQRWATLCRRRFVRSITHPEQLLSSPIPASRAHLIPAFQALEELKILFSCLDILWGPAGSIGFELLTHQHVATPESDLDIVILAQRHMTKSEAAHLYHIVAELPQRIDIRVETGRSGFLLKEYANELTTKYILRTPAGDFLDEDPWNPGV